MAVHCRLGRGDGGGVAIRGDGKLGILRPARLAEAAAPGDGGLDAGIAVGEGARPALIAAPDVENVPADGRILDQA